MSRVHFAGREWFAYGNAALLELPVIEPFRCSRKWAENGDEWREAVGRAARIGPGGADVDFESSQIYSGSLFDERHENACEPTWLDV